jgi:hypothetical protein
MTRIRDHLRKGAVLALIALAFQLAASFGHIHSEDAPGPCASAGQSQDAADRHDDAPDDHAGEDCALCAVLSLAAFSLLPDAPQLDVPVVARARFANPVHDRPREARAALFRARAPPLA